MLPPLMGRTQHGKPASWQFDGARDSLIYVFSLDCHWCEKNEPSVRQLLRLSSPAIRTVGVGLGRVADQKLGSPEWVIWNPDESTRKAYGLRGTPMTILASKTGKVIKVWRGAFVGPTKREIEATFGLQLPEVQ